jgi:predicted ArsR family transcriptional regulator
MAANEYGKRFHESTRGRVVELLRLKSRTVDELAAALGLTDNAVRMHLATLERDGIVRQEGVRRGAGAGKPASIFGIVAEAEGSFSRAYVPLLLALLEELAEREDDAAIESIMRSVGRRLAAPLGAAGDRTARLHAARSLLIDLGALADVHEEDGRVMIRGNGCVVGLAVSQHPAVCRAIETLLSEVLNEEVHECCDRAGRPSCCFRVGANGQDR